MFLKNFASITILPLAFATHLLKRQLAQMVSRNRKAGPVLHKTGRQINHSRH